MEGRRGSPDLSKGEVGLKLDKFLVTSRIVFSKKKNKKNQGDKWHHYTTYCSHDYENS